MAILIPDTPKDCPYGERTVFEKLGRDLDHDWIVLHSLGLPGHPTKIWGEADIVVLSTKGIFALEVKGGKVSCRDGIWHFGEPGREGFTKKEDPWTQAKGTMFAVRERLTQADHTFSQLLFGFGVVMPMETFTTEGAEIEHAVLLDKRDFRRDLGYYIGQLQRHWSAMYEEKHGRSPRLPTRADIRRIREILRPDVESAYSLGSYLNGVESRLLQLSNDQIRVSRRMSANPRTVVRGQAGTGKTIIAIERAAMLAQQGHRVLYLCYNQLLAEHIRLSLAGDPRGSEVQVRHVHSLYREVIEKAGMLARLKEVDTDAQDLYSTVFPEVFVEAFIETGYATYDALVIDEAQDLLTPENLEAFDVLLTAGLNRGRWHIFLDPLQNIYNTEVQDRVEKRLVEGQPAFDDLFENCRNTRQVAVQASIISGIDLAVEGAPDGPDCENIYYRDAAAFRKAIENEVKVLVSRDVRPEDIVILSPRKRENSLLAEIRTLAGMPIFESRDASHTGILFSTMHSFKGLERQVVLAIDMDGIGQPQLAMLHYAGLSRAKVLLRTFLPDVARNTYVQQAVRYGERRVKK
jgi:hypothetical protein